MKTIYVCKECGSTRVFADAWASLNTSEVRTFDATHCDECEGPTRVKGIAVEDDFDPES